MAFGQCNEVWTNLGSYLLGTIDCCIIRVWCNRSLSQSQESAQLLAGPALPEQVLTALTAKTGLQGIIGLVNLSPYDGWLESAALRWGKRTTGEIVMPSVSLSKNLTLISYCERSLALQLMQDSPCCASSLWLFLTCGHEAVCFSSFPHPHNKKSYQHQLIFLRSFLNAALVYTQYMSRTRSVYLGQTELFQDWKKSSHCMGSSAPQYQPEAPRLEQEDISKFPASGLCQWPAQVESFGHSWKVPFR